MAGEVFTHIGLHLPDTSPAPKRAGEVFIYTAGEVFIHFSSAREVFIYTAGEVFIHFSSAGEAGEVFIYTEGHCSNGSHSIRCQTLQVCLDVFSVQLTQQYGLIEQ